MNNNFPAIPPSGPATGGEIRRIQRKQTRTISGIMPLNVHNLYSREETDECKKDKEQHE
jgi:hypothetical protein